MSHDFEFEYATSTFYGEYDNSTEKDLKIVTGELYGKILTRFSEEKLYPIKITDPQITVTERILKGNEIIEKGVLFITYIAMPMVDYPMFNGNMKNFKL